MMVIPNLKLEHAKSQEGRFVASVRISREHNLYKVQEDDLPLFFNGTIRAIPSSELPQDEISKFNLDEYRINPLQDSWYLTFFLENDNFLDSLLQQVNYLHQLDPAFFMHLSSHCRIQTNQSIARILTSLDFDPSQMGEWALQTPDGSTLSEIFLGFYGKGFGVRLLSDIGEPIDVLLDNQTFLWLNYLTKTGFREYNPKGQVELAFGAG
jgi:hypothetical protein